MVLFVKSFYQLLFRGEFACIKRNVQGDKKSAFIISVSFKTGLYSIWKVTLRDLRLIVSCLDTPHLKLNIEILNSKA